MKKIVICVFLMCLGVSTLQAQDEDNIWAVSLGVNAVDVNKGGLSKLGSTLKDYSGWSDWNLPGFSVSVARYLNHGLSFKLAGSFNEISLAPLNGDEDHGYDQVLDAPLSFMAFDGVLVYDLNSLFGQTGWFDPYVSFQVGASILEGDLDVGIGPGLGFNSWINKRIGIGVTTVYSASVYGEGLDVSAGGTGYFQHTLGVVYKFGGISKHKDTDEDGIGDKEDLCIYMAGPEETGGCPDTDGDGVPDKDDNCPKIVGGVGGCPDSDGDGVIDKEDKCSDFAGTDANGGCPDTDEDGILDMNDKCPEVAGPVENNGCVWPDADGDGVPDKDDKCPDDAGVGENGGCSAGLTQEEKALLKSLSIRFKFDKLKFNPETKEKLNEAAEVLKANPTFKFNINGYTDSTGSESVNKRVSLKRAQSVEKYLVSKGVDSSQLTTVGYGESNPIASNKTREGRAANRRAEVVVVE